MDKVLMTGATGFVGGRLADQLLDEGYELTILARTPETAERFADRGAEVVEGDVTEPATIRPALEGVDGVFHLAAIYELGGDLEWMREVNVEGTRHVIEEAIEAGVSRIVYCGSDTSLGNTHGEVRDETKEHGGGFRSNYEQTKYEAHRLVEELIDQGAPVVNTIVSTVYGAGDESPVAELIEHHLAGRAVAHLDRRAGYTFTHVDDVADALRLAYEEGEIGERYLVSGEPATFEEFFEALSEQTGIAAPRFEIPGGLVDTLRPLVEAAAPLVGKSAEEVRESLAMGRNVTRFFSGAKTREDLGWEPRTLEEGLRETLPDFERREADRASRWLEGARWPLAALAVFDLGLGVTATFLPETFVGIMHPGAESGAGLLVSRTGMLWLVFSAVQGVAALDPLERPEWVMAAGVFRLMDVPADLTYLITSDDLGVLGTAGLMSSPIFNAATGAFFAYAGYRGLRAHWKESSVSDGR